MILLDGQYDLSLRLMLLRLKISTNRILPSLSHLISFRLRLTSTLAVLILFRMAALGFHRWYFSLSIFLFLLGSLFSTLVPPILTDDDPFLVFLIRIRVFIGVHNLIENVLLLVVSIEHVLLIASHKFLKVSLSQAKKQTSRPDQNLDT